MTRRITQQGGHDSEGPFHHDRVAPSFQLFPQGQGRHLPLIVKERPLQPMQVRGGQQAMDSIGDRPAPVEREGCVVGGIENGGGDELKNKNATNVRPQEEESAVFQPVCVPGTGQFKGKKVVSALSV